MSAKADDAHFYNLLLHPKPMPICIAEIGSFYHKKVNVDYPQTLNLNQDKQAPAGLGQAKT